MGEITRCPFCSSKISLAWREGTFFRCLSCGLLIRNANLSQDDLHQLYETSWVLPFERTGETGATTTRLATLYVNRLKETLRIDGFQDMVIVDYGAGRGAMSLALREAGATVYAVEPYGCEFLRENGLQAYESLRDLPSGVVINGIVSLDVVEHLPNPWEDLKQLKALLISGGWLFLSTPNSEGLNARVFGHQWREALRAGHLFLFNENSLRSQLEFAGYSHVHRLGWDIVYDSHFPIRFKDWLLCKIKLDGELRFIAHKA